MPSCFVVMGFGVKTDYQTGRKLDLDKSYQNLIKPAVEAAGLQCTRADEIVHAGIIDVPMYEQLLTADVVVADVSTMNPNAFYELGVRHALRPYTTVIVAESELKFPFDIGHSVIRQYKHLGEDIGVSEAQRFQKELSSAIRQITAQPADDSPVYRFLRLKPPTRIQEQIDAMARDTSFSAVTHANNEPLAVLLERAKKARANGKWAVAKAMLQEVKQEMDAKAAAGGAGVDPYVLQQLALATYKADDTEAGLNEACQLLWVLNPQTSNDPETLGLWGAVHKRLWEKARDRRALDKAIAAYERGFYLRNDHYTGINFAFLLNLRSAASSGEEAIADRVVANRIRREVIAVCKALLNESELNANDQYWAMAAMAESYFGTGDTDQYDSIFRKAKAIAPELWMVETTRSQIEKLADLIGSPRPRE
jgi:hypothetical protein